MNQDSLFPDYEDDKIYNLDDDICFQWFFSAFFWPTDAQVLELSTKHRVLAQTILERCSVEFDKHYYESPD